MNVQFPHQRSAVCRGLLQTLYKSPSFRETTHKFRVLQYGGYPADVKLEWTGPLQGIAVGITVNAFPVVYIQG